MKEHSLAVLKRQIQESRDLLGSYLDLYQIHSASLESGVLDNQAVLSQLAKLKRDGLRIGLSLSGPGQSETLFKAMEVSLDGQPLFDTVQATWNLLERSAGPAVLQASDMGIGVIIKETLANGLLTENNRDPAFATKLDILKDEARKHGSTVDALALAGVLAQPWVDIALSGAATVHHLNSNTAALAIKWTAEVASHLELLVETPESYWRRCAELIWN